MTADKAAQIWQSRLTKHGLDEVRRLARRGRSQPRARRFIFLRHGETEGNARRVYQPPEIPLNPTGQAQARRAAEYLREHPVERILASDMRRAWQTAQAAAEIVGAPVIAGAAPARKMVRRSDRHIVAGPRLAQRAAERRIACPISLRAPRTA